MIHEKIVILTKKKMKKISIFLLAIIISSCSSMESDADKVCEFAELNFKKVELSFVAMSGDKKVQKELKEVEDKIGEMEKDIEKLNKKYEGNEEFEKYLEENCDKWKKMNDMVKELEEGLKDFQNFDF